MKESSSFPVSQIDLLVLKAEFSIIILFNSIRQESMVDRNLLKLQVRKLRETLFSRADEVFSLEKRKLELNTAMTERSKEIDIFKEILEAQIRSGTNDKQKVYCIPN